MPQNSVSISIIIIRLQMVFNGDDMLVKEKEQETENVGCKMMSTIRRMMMMMMTGPQTNMKPCEPPPTIYQSLLLHSCTCLASQAKWFLAPQGSG